MRQLSIVTVNKAGAADGIIVRTAAIGLFLSTLDTGIMNVALPSLNRAFHSSVSTLSWTVTVYLLLLSATIVWFGRLSDRIGRVKVYSVGLLVFGIASVLCGCSMTPIQLIACRGIQGIGAAMMQATATAIITTTIPSDRRGAALGTLGMMLGLGPVLGPSIGGLLLSTSSWQWIFWINVPICALGIWGCRRIPKPISGQHGRTKLNLLGIIVPLFSVTVLGLATAVAFIVPPYFLERVSELPPWQVGLVNLAAPLGLVVLSRVSGRRIPRHGTTRLMGLGLGVMFIALAILCGMGRNWSAAALFTLLLSYGVGAGIFVPANLTAIMENAGMDAQGMIGAVQRMVQNIGIAVGTGVSATLMDFQSKAGLRGLMSAFREAWGFAGLLVLVSLIATIFLSRRWFVSNG